MRRPKWIHLSLVRKFERNVSRLNMFRGTNETLLPSKSSNQWDLYWMVGPEANHATVLGLKPLLDVQEMTNGLELEPFGSFRSPCQGMPLQGPVCASEDAASVRSKRQRRLWGVEMLVNFMHLHLTQCINEFSGALVWAIRT